MPLVPRHENEHFFMIYARHPNPILGMNAVEPSLQQHKTTTKLTKGPLDLPPLARVKAKEHAFNTDCATFFLDAHSEFKIGVSMILEKQVKRGID